MTLIETMVIYLMIAKYANGHSNSGSAGAGYAMSYLHSEDFDKLLKNCIGEKYTRGALQLDIFDIYNF